MIQILYEDNHLIAVNKPAGFLTQPDQFDQKNIEDLCKAWIKKKYQKPGKVYLDAAHRIDKPVSGVVLFARTSKASSRLKKSIREGETIKVYLALVEGDLPDSGILEHYLVHDDFRARVVPNKSKQSKLAVLHYRTLKKINDNTLVEVHLKTGRYHQIRAQFAEIGCPIVGDLKYGAKKKHRMEGIALHHHRFVIPHPTKAQLMKFESLPSWI